MEIRGVDNRERFYDLFSNGENINNELNNNKELVNKISKYEKAGNNKNQDKDKKLKDSINLINNMLNKRNLKVETERHEFFRDTMIKIVNSDTGEVVSEVPPKDILDLVAKLCEMAGVLVDKKV